MDIHKFVNKNYIEQIFPSLCNKMKDDDKFINELETTLILNDVSMEVLVRRKKYFNWL